MIKIEFCNNSRIFPEKSADCEKVVSNRENRGYDLLREVFVRFDVVHPRRFCFPSNKKIFQVPGLMLLRTHCVGIYRFVDKCSMALLSHGMCGGSRTKILLFHGAIHG